MSSQLEIDWNREIIHLPVYRVTQNEAILDLRGKISTLGYSDKFNLKKKNEKDIPKNAKTSIKEGEGLV